MRCSIFILNKYKVSLYALKTPYNAFRVWRWYSYLIRFGEGTALTGYIPIISPINTGNKVSLRRSRYYY